jgi:hypothetical protein
MSWKAGLWLCVTVASFTAACGSSGGSSGAASTDATSTAESRTAVCAAEATKKCLGAVNPDVAGCEAELAGKNAAFVDALKRCVDTIGACQNDYNAEVVDCAKKATAEVTPGFPNVPLVTQCKDRDTACQLGVAYRCERLPRLDAAGKARIEECRAKADCPAFDACLRELT